MKAVVYIALGSNLDRPSAQIAHAIALLLTEDLRPLRRARTYRSRPVGPTSQPEFVNSMVEAKTNLGPVELLARLKSIESRMGRKHTVRWGPRVIDLDIILYEDLVIEEEALTIPHREMTRRRFVLAPLMDLAPERIVPGLGQTVHALLDALGPDRQGDIRVLEDEVLILGHDEHDPGQPSG